MGYRRFVDRHGRDWEVRDRSRYDWELQPLSGNPEPARTVRAPGYESDPFELSVEELQRLVDESGPPRSPAKPSPFLD